MRGFTNGNFTASTAPKNNLPMAMNYAGNQFLLEQNTLIIDKAVDIESDEFNWGFRAYIPVFIRDVGYFWSFLQNSKPVH